MADSMILSLSCIYQIRNTVTGKVYVGSAANLKKRWSNHVKSLRLGNHHSKKLQHSWNKHGEDSFVIEILESVPDIGSLLGREQYWIDALNSVGSGYNISPTAGSPRGVKHTDAARANMSAAHMGKKPSPEVVARWVKNVASKGQSEEARRKISIANTGKKRTGEALLNIQRSNALIHLGRKDSPEVRERRAAALRGKKHSEEAKLNMSNGQRGRVVSEETRRKISESMKEAGIQPSSEAREKASKATKGVARKPEVMARITAAHKARREIKLSAKK